MVYDVVYLEEFINNVTNKPDAIQRTYWSHSKEKLEQMIKEKLEGGVTISNVQYNHRVWDRSFLSSYPQVA